MNSTFYNDENYLAHFGVKGMKWGVRKDRNRSRYYSRSRRKANNIYRTLSDAEKSYLTAEKRPPKEYVSRKEYSRKGSNVFSIIEQQGHTPVSVLDLWDQGNRTVATSVATRNDPRFRGKGHARKAVEAGKRWLASHPEYTAMSWTVNVNNEASRKLAASSGFKLDHAIRYPDSTWEYYLYENPSRAQESL